MLVDQSAKALLVFQYLRNDMVELGKLNFWPANRFWRGFEIVVKKLLKISDKLVSMTTRCFLGPEFHEVDGALIL